jgi:hypothetical protein
MIFDGTVVMYVQGKENAVDTYLDIWAGDADKALSNGVIAMTFPAKTTYKQEVERIIEISMPEVKVEQIDIPGDRASVRAHTRIGMTAEELRKIANASGTHFWIDSSQFLIIPYKGYARGTAVVLSPTTGLVGMPEVTPEGIQAKCLLNPKLRLGGEVNIETSLLSNVPFLPGSSTPFYGAGLPSPAGEGSPALPFKKWSAAPTSPTGRYKILMLEHHGDIRGPTWYSQMMCAATDTPGLLNYNSAFVRSKAIGEFEGGWQTTIKKAPQT